MLWRKALLGSAYRRASAASAGLREISRTPSEFEFSASSAFSDTTRFDELNCWDYFGLSSSLVSAAVPRQVLPPGQRTDAVALLAEAPNQTLRRELRKNPPRDGSGRASVKTKIRAVVEGRPPRLTDFGMEIASFMDSWLNKAVCVVESKVRRRRVSCEALQREVYRLSRRYVYSRLSPTLKEKVKECSNVKGTTVEKIRRVFAVSLSDRLYHLLRF